MKAVRQNIGVAFVPREDIRNAAALNSLSFNVSHTLGQAVFGLVTALGASLLGGAGDDMRGLAFPFHLNMASFVLVLWVLATLPFPRREHGRPRHACRRSSGPG